MQITFRLGTIAGAAAAALAVAIPAAQASPAPHVAAPANSLFSTEQAGYQIAHGTNTYRFATQTFTLPDAGNFAANVGSFGLSVQGWSSKFVVVLGISTCATDTCQTGGTAVNEPWNAAIAVYNPVTQALITADGNSPAMAAGDSVTEQLFYNAKTGNVQAKVIDNTTQAVFAVVEHTGLNQAFKATRFGFETSAVSPWGPPAFTYNAPASAVQVAGFAQISATTLKGKKANLLASTVSAPQPVTWTRNGMSTGAVNASSSKPSANGQGFSVSLQP